MKKNKITKVALSSALALVLIGTADKVVASDWHANSIETIVENVKGDQQKYNKKEYDIRWGDYLFGISKATGVNLDTLAQINNIANKDLIIAGNKLYYGTDSNVVTKDGNGHTKVYQEKRYDGSNKVAEVPKTSLTGKEEKAIKDKNPGLAKDFNDDKKVNDKIIKDNKGQIKDLDKEIKDIKAEADKKIKEQEDIKKDLIAQKDKLVKEDKEKNKDEIAKIDEKIKEADKKIEDIKAEADKKVEEKEKQKDYLKTENEKLEADKKGDKKTSDEKQKELDDKKENDPYEIWKKEQLKKNPNLKEEDLTREQYEISKKDEDKKEEKPDTPKKDEDGKKDEGKDKPVEPKEDPKKKDEGKKEETPDTPKENEKEEKPDTSKENEKILVYKAFVNGHDARRDIDIYKVFMYPVTDGKIDEHRFDAYNMAGNYMSIFYMSGNYGDLDWEELTLKEIKEQAKDKDVYLPGEYDDINLLKEEADWNIKNYYTNNSLGGRAQDKYKKEAFEKYKKSIKNLEEKYRNPNTSAKEMYEALLNESNSVPAPAFDEIKELEDKIFVYPDDNNFWFGDYIDDEEAEEAYRYYTSKPYNYKRENIIIIRSLEGYDEVPANYKKFKDSLNNTDVENKTDEKEKPVEPKEDSKKKDESKKEDKSEEKSDTSKANGVKEVSEVVPFKTKRAYNDPSLKTRVKQEGKNGLNVYDVTYKNGKEVSKKLNEKKSYPAVDQIIESYVKVQDAKYETKEVDDKSKPIYDDVVIYRAFVNEFPYIPDSLDKKLRELERKKIDYNITAEESLAIENEISSLLEPYCVQKVFESEISSEDAYGKAYDYIDTSDCAGNYGTMDPRVEHRLVGYEKTTQNIKIQDELWDWR